jgi:ribokinase
LDSLLSLVDVITPNEAEAQALAGLPDERFTPEAAARALRARGVRTVLCTLGESGAHVFDDSGGRRIPSVHVPVVDTTGAGDAFTGALAVGLARGWGTDEAASFANLAGAFCVTRPGVVPGLGAERELLNLRELGEKATSTIGEA